MVSYRLIATGYAMLSRCNVIHHRIYADITYNIMITMQVAVDCHCN